MKRFARILGGVFLVLAARNVMAGCVSDCRDEYESDVSSCHHRYDDDPDEADTYRRCIDSAKDDYDSCTDNCES